ncbi:MAG TPA: DNA gyrase C-terminal beta-propeller domain-containing protein, partial [Myxococcales bacterium]|nr:DNA gyrase C-terminal beta-propeller domain-containing protein [Myxococcales bacterium]
AILEMKLYRLAKLEILVIEKELKEKRAEQKRLKELLGNDRGRWAVVREEIAEIQKAYADKRRTKIGGAGSEEVEYSEEAFIADEDAQVVLTRDGWVKRVRELKDPSQTRVREGDEVAFVLGGSLKSNLVLFSNFGTAYVTRFNDVPASTGYGDPVQKLFKFDDNERVVGALSLDKRVPRPEKLLGLSRGGYGLRFALAPHTEISTRAGRRFARPAKEDELIGVVPVEDKDFLAVVTEKAYALVTKAKEVNELAGPGRGVRVIKVQQGDKLVGFLCTSDKKAELPLESSKGRKLELTLREASSRGGKGRQLVRKDAIKVLPSAPVVQALPSEEKK